MRATSVASLALIGTAALTFGAPAALAADEGNTVTPFGFTVTPTTVAPGGTVTLSATECEATAATASSDVFDTVTLSAGRPATARVSEDAKPGAEHQVTFDCAGEKGTSALAITGGSKSEPSAGAVSGSESEQEPETAPGPASEPALESVPDVPDVPGSKLDSGPVTASEPESKPEAEFKPEPPPQPGLVPDSGSHTVTGPTTGMTKPGGGVKAGAGGSLAELSPAQLAAGSVLVAGALGGAVVLLLRHRTHANAGG
ncbi:hypothetical protein ACIHCQ_30480 [Streptomyces sp. NPDC052236]|uniref:hypothetical protein n=1 Tax=Streptomyces sp. NPDC052236 TaxID=3365686 RepID=UPI0037D91332